MRPPRIEPLSWIYTHDVINGYESHDTSENTRAWHVRMFAKDMATRQMVADNTYVLCYTWLWDLYTVYFLDEQEKVPKHYVNDDHLTRRIGAVRPLPSTYA